MPKSCPKGAKKGAKRLPRSSFWSKNGYKKGFKYTLRFRRDFEANCSEKSEKIYSSKLQLKPKAQRGNHFALKA